MDPNGAIALPAGVLAALGAAWAAVEFGLSAYDIYDFARTMTDSCSTNLDKILSGGGLLAGMALPGGGYGAGSKASNRALHERYKDGLRASMEKPPIRDEKLSSIVDKLYRPNASVGSGSTAAAVRQELATGAPVGGAFYSQKAQDSLIALQRWMDRNPTASSGDRAAAENIIIDMQNALRGQ